MNPPIMQRRYEALLNLAQHPYMTCKQLAARMSVGNRSNVYALLRALHAEGQVHIAEWMRTAGKPVPGYAIGKGVDAVRPLPVPQSVLNRQWERRNPHKVREIQRRKAERRRLTLPDTVQQERKQNGHSDPGLRDLLEQHAHTQEDVAA